MTTPDCDEILQGVESPAQALDEALAKVQDAPEVVEARVVSRSTIETCCPASDGPAGR